MAIPDAIARPVLYAFDEYFFRIAKTKAVTSLDSSPPDKPSEIA